MDSTSLHFVFFPLMAQGHMIPMVDIAKLLAQQVVVATLYYRAGSTKISTVLVSAMDSISPHFVFFPLMAQGHMIPMVDIAKLLAQRGAVATLFVTPQQALRINKVVDRASLSGLPIRIAILKFPYGLAEQYEFLDQLPSSDQIFPFFTSLFKLQQPAEELIADLKPPPTCIVADSTLTWTLDIADKFNIPWITFVGGSCFCPVVMHKTYSSRVFTSVTSDEEYFTVPGFPDKIELSTAQLPTTQVPDMIAFYQQMRKAERRAFGKIVNSFEELEPAYVEEYKRENGGRIWCVGPVSLCHEDDNDKAERGSQSSMAHEAQRCLKWLDSQKPDSVIYVCLGSLCTLKPPQLIELGLGLEASNGPFVWVIRTANNFEELEKWMSETAYEERIKGRGLLIRGWAPQVLILSHPAVGGFLTHCGWNSILEGISAGVPMVSWPLFSEQFVNEQQLVNVLKVAVKIGTKRPVKWGKEEEETSRIQVNREDVKEAIEALMGEGDEAETRRRMAREYSELAKKAVGDGGSSQLNITLLIDEIHKTRAFHQESN